MGYLYMFLSLTCFGLLGIFAKVADLRGCKPGAVYTFTVAELNAWARAKAPTVVPQGLRELRLELGNNSATGTALVDFIKLRKGAGEETNPPPSGYQPKKFKQCQARSRARPGDHQGNRKLQCEQTTRIVDQALAFQYVNNSAG